MDASTKVTPSVSETSSGVTIEQVENLLAERDVWLVNLISAMVLIAVGKHRGITDDTSPISTVLSTEIPISQPSRILPVS